MIKPVWIFATVYLFSLTFLIVGLNGYAEVYYIANEIINVSLLYSLDLVSRCRKNNLSAVQFGASYGLLSLNLCNIIAILFLSSYEDYKFIFGLVILIFSGIVFISSSLIYGRGFQH